jgi:hypothetical protein
MRSVIDLYPSSLSLQQLSLMNDALRRVPALRFPSPSPLPSPPFAAASLPPPVSTTTTQPASPAAAPTPTPPPPTLPTMLTPTTLPTMLTRACQTAVDSAAAEAHLRAHRLDTQLQVRSGSVKGKVRLKGLESRHLESRPKAVSKFGS